MVVQTSITHRLRHSRDRGVDYLLTTTFPSCDQNEDIVTGDWRLLNLQRPPFNFPPPLRLMNERCTESRGAFGDKSLGLWLVGQLPTLDQTA